YSYIGVFVIFINLFLVILLTIIEGDKLVIYSLFVVIVSLLSFLIPYIYIKIHFKNVNYKSSLDIKLFKSMLSFTGWSLYGNLSGVGFNQGVSILLNIFFGPTVNAARAVSSQINGALLGIVGNVNMAANPQIIRNYSSGEKKAMIDLVFSTSKYSFLCLSLISLPVLVNIDYILNLWLGDVPKYSREFSVLVIIDALVCGFSGSLMTSIQATGRIKYYQITIGTILLLNIPMSYIFLNHYENAIIPFLITIFLSFIAFNFRVFFMKKYLEISIVEYYKYVVFGAVSSFVLSLISIILIKEAIPLVRDSFVLTMILCPIISVFSIWYIALNRKEKKFIKNKIRAINNK
ncbi:lipopolysaccharide biosynthesis protein, partial [Vibrio cyclitrophicus]